MKTGIWALCAVVLGTATACEKKSACTGDEVTVEISGNHGHSVSVPGSGARRGIGGTYPLKGGTHEHIIHVMDEDLSKLNAGERVTTRATSVNGHTHEVTLSCPR
jgi:hypothetical protein